MFEIPGGIQTYLVMDIVLLVIGLIRFRYVILRQRPGMWFALLQAACGMLAFRLHEWFLWMGHPEFTLPMTQAVLILTLAVSSVLATFALPGSVKEQAPVTQPAAAPSAVSGGGVGPLATQK